MNTETTPASGSAPRPRPLFKPTPLRNLSVGDTFSISGFGMKDRILYTKVETYSRKKGEAVIDVCRCTYSVQDKRCNVMEQEKVFEADIVVLLMQRKNPEGSIGNS